MTGKRTKHSFSFESFDNYNPYEIQESGIAKKTAIFNYSTEYFRKKSSDSNGSYLIAGGNIPWNMKASLDFAPVDLSNGNNIPPPITCVLNRGSATPLTNITPFNLSPNKIPKEPCPCKRNPQYDAMVAAGLCFDGAPCNQEIKADDGSVQLIPVMAELYIDCTDSSVVPERGSDRKPNFLYLPTYQTSCSTHQRAKGYAHEDNYDCLKENKFGAGDKDSVCCDTFCSCAYSHFAAFEKNEYPNPNFHGKAGETIYDEDGNLIPEKFMGFSPICAKEIAVGFCCNKTWVDNFIDYDYRIGFSNIFNDVCTNDCNFGFFMDTTGTKYRLNTCPGLDINDDGEKDPDYEFPDSSKDIIQHFTDQTGIEVKPEDFYPYSSKIAKVFLADGNRNCGCGGEGGIVTINGSRECRKCWYILPASMNPSIGYDGPIIVIESTKCTTTSDPNTQNEDSENGPVGRSVCGCIFNDEINFGDAGIVYITTLTYPSKIFPNGSILEIDDNGRIRARGCGDEFIYNCNDVN